MVSINVVGSALFRSSALSVPRRSEAVRFPQLQSLSLGGPSEEICPMYLEELLAGSGLIQRLELSSALLPEELEAIIEKGLLSGLRSLYLRSWGTNFGDGGAVIIASKQRE